MSCNSAIYCVNTTSQSLLANAQIPFGTIVRRFGRFVNLDGFGITLCGQGYYECNCSVTLEPAAIGNVSVQLYLNGEPYPGAIATAYVATADEPINLSFPAIIRVKGCEEDTASTVMVRLGAAATIDNMAFTAKKI